MISRANKLLVETIKSFMGIDVTITRSRRKEVVMARACVIMVLRNYYLATMVQAAKLYKMDHSTVVYHASKHSHRYKHEDDYAKIYEHLLKVCTQASKPTINTNEVYELIECAMAI